MKKTILAELIVLFWIPVLASAASWEIDPAHSTIEFKIRHLMVSNVKGTFQKVKGLSTFEDQNITDLKVEVTIEAASINTGNARRDDHLRNVDFFDVAKYPTITFISKRVVKSGTNKLNVIGDLTIHGVTREVGVEVEGLTTEIRDPQGRFRRGATGTTRISRKDFGLTWNRVIEAGGLMVGDDVDISVEVELIRK